jgi:valyl-tRNA synthetase
MVGQRHNLEIINIMNPDGTLNDRCPAEYVGLDRFAARDLCVKRMEEAGLLEKIEDITHSVGYSERGGVPIETLVSAQWFCKMGELAKPAIEAVKSGKIKFYPERWSKTYFHWMENIQDWCISRQLWWGHRIPAWYNDETGEVYVGTEAPTAPGKWRQEEDVLDTWFSSWLWPFSIMGWPEQTAELKRFYPTNDLVTGPDIIFFWVARMIMAGEEFMGDIPFRNVYFTSIIRDEKGRKLSKSLGNSPDPLEVIAEYGADALRFSIVYIAPVGLDIKYSNEKCEIGRNFANKLWNACRFRQMQGDVTDFARKLPEVELSADERWMLAKLDAAVVTIEDELKKFRFHTAAHALYDLVWSDFCDWFVEAEKRPFRAGGADRERALAVLDYTLFTILKLLHPFMPFITEELAHRMGFVDADGTLMYEEFPKPGACGKYVSDPVIPLVEGKFELVRGGRFLRSSYNIADGKKLNFHIKAASPESLAFLNGELESLKLLLNAEQIDLSLDAFDSAALGAAPKQVCQLGVISLPLAGLIDVAAEKVKLEKQLKDLDGWIRGTEAKLANEKFLNGAPPQVVADAKSKLAELVERRERTVELLKDLN